MAAWKSKPQKAAQQGYSRLLDGVVRTTAAQQIDVRLLPSLPCTSKLAHRHHQVNIPLSPHPPACKEPYRLAAGSDPARYCAGQAVEQGAPGVASGLLVRGCDELVGYGHALLAKTPGQATSGGEAKP